MSIGGVKGEPGHCGKESFSFHQHQSLKNAESFINSVVYFFSSDVEQTKATAIQIFLTSNLVFLNCSNNFYYISEKETAIFVFEQQEEKEKW